ncbi:HD-GYP domain-containing protein [Azoarcus olearius]|uniref:HD-domain containing protein n=1 Tax=Azoarcus sp. (strain BH72) TaxID=418699 RepID=A1K7L2_AZOSB|nr:HD domain-containing phosphohydrolase [Azoarcus olearius]CAL94817.1 HD-domain containing protein [Azoarcus olearius]
MLKAQFISPSPPPSTRENLSSRLQDLHGIIATRHPEINRIALATYDEDTDLLKTFINSTYGDATPFGRYEARLSEVPSLQRLALSGEKRILQNLPEALASRDATHSRWLTAAGFHSSYTVPIYHGERFVAFLFFDADRPNAFSDEVLRYLDLIGYLAAQMYLTGLVAVRTLISTVEVARGLTRIRDIETGHHLDRIAHYTRIITRGLADIVELDDEFIEHVFLFAPLHDIGKIGVPDSILQKPGPLTLEERKIMQSHVELGVSVFDRMVQDIGLPEDRTVRIMRNIIAYHHEALDGTGYPYRLSGDAVPLEARIVAIADIFDALTSERPYKPRWPNEAAFAELSSMAERGKIDAECVRAFLNNRAMVEDTQARFAENLNPAF